MTMTLKGQFETRREAEMTVERLVQEYGVDRSAIIVAAAGDENSAGVERAGSDEPSGAPSKELRHDAALEGVILVMVELDNDVQAEEVRAAFAEFGADTMQDG